MGTSSLGPEGWQQSSAKEMNMGNSERRLLALAFQVLAAAMLAFVAFVGAAMIWWLLLGLGAPVSPFPDNFDWALAVCAFTAGATFVGAWRRLYSRPIPLPRVNAYWKAGIAAALVILAAIGIGLN
jgi:hypothetical protein